MGIYHLHQPWGMLTTVIGSVFLLSLPTRRFRCTWVAIITHSGQNVRRVVIKNEEGKTLIDVPLTLGVVGAVLLPVWAAIGAIAALVTDCTIVVEKVKG